MLTLPAANLRQRFRLEGGGYHDVYEPSQEEIALACKEIRAEWSDEDYASRKAFNPDEPQGWTAPLWRDSILSLL
jgi:hypothetical protein